MRPFLESATIGRMRELIARAQPKNRIFTIRDTPTALGSRVPKNR